MVCDVEMAAEARTYTYVAGKYSTRKHNLSIVSEIFATPALAVPAEGTE